MSDGGRETDQRTQPKGGSVLTTETRTSWDKANVTLAKAKAIRQLADASLFKPDGSVNLFKTGSIVQAVDQDDLSLLETNDA